MQDERGDGSEVDIAAFRAYYRPLAIVGHRHAQELILCEKNK